MNTVEETAAKAAHEILAHPGNEEILSLSLAALGMAATADALVIFRNVFGGKK